MNNIRYLRRKDINEEAWNRCIDEAPNGLIYAYTYYLDAMCIAWDGLVLNDYEAVMPLPWRRKWGITYIYPPAFTQQLGFIGNNLKDAINKDAVAIIQNKFLFGEYYFNFNNYPIGMTKTNLVLNLNQPYITIRNNYKKDLFKNLKRSKKHSLNYRSIIDFQKATILFQSEYGNRMPHVSTRDYNNLRVLFRELQQKDQLIIREVLDSYNNEILAVAVCPKDDKRIYFLLSVTTLRGKKKQANHFLVDQLIKEFSGSQLLLDFEGSDIAGIAHFYKNYGAKKQSFFFYRWNKLPWPLNVLKEKSLDAF